ncbi:MAG: peroxiredoxin family protein [Acidobacteria bacterium]|nr:peroxiredoxin family protein [Acidobacteriota bacterium]
MPEPLVGEIVPDFALFSTTGTRVRVSDYRGKCNLVLIFCGTGCCESVRSLVGELSGMYADFVAEEAELFAVVQGADREVEDFRRSCDPPFPVLADKEGHGHDFFGAPASEQDSFPVICVVDRYGEVWQVFRAVDSEASCAARDILDWVRYINLECPE